MLDRIGNKLVFGEHDALSGYTAVLAYLRYSKRLEILAIDSFQI